MIYITHEEQGERKRAKGCYGLLQSQQRLKRKQRNNNSYYFNDSNGLESHIVAASIN